MSLGIDSGQEWNSGRFVPDQAAGIAWVRRAILELGCRHVDTAMGYGRGLSEAWLGEALRGIPRDQVVVTTKVSRALPGHDHGFSRGNIHAVCRQSLQRLGLERLDFLMFHHLRFDGREDEAIAAMEELVAQGLIGAYAACPTDPLAEVTARYPGLRPGHWHTHGGPFWHRPGDADLDLARRRREPVVVFAPYLYGLLTGRDPGAVLTGRGSVNGAWRHPWFVPPAGHGLYRSAHDPERTLAAIASVKSDFKVDAAGFRTLLLRYVLALPGVASVCIGFSKWEHLAEAAAAVRQPPLAQADLQRMSARLFDAGR